MRQKTTTACGRSGDGCRRYSQVSRIRLFDSLAADTVGELFESGLVCFFTGQHSRAGRPYCPERYGRVPLSDQALGYCDRAITSLDCESFFVEALGDQAAGRELYKRACAARDSTPKVILHQTARLVSLADWMDEVAPSRPALKIFFFVVLAEEVAKMAFGFVGKGKSAEHVHRFFCELCPSPDRERLARSFRRTDTTPHAQLLAADHSPSGGPAVASRQLTDRHPTKDKEFDPAAFREVKDRSDRGLVALPEFRL